MIAIISCCGTNLASIDYACQRLGATTLVTADAAAIRQASHVILPGVGQAGYAMSNLHCAGLTDTIKNLKQPVLGICLGMQLLYEQSEEGAASCLGIIPGKVKRFSRQASLIVPHMGWNQLTLQQSSVHHPLFHNIDNAAYVYYVHTFFARPGSETLACTTYGGDFSAVIQSKNFYGMQFHPEKSGRVGERLLNNFLAME